MRRSALGKGVASLLALALAGACAAPELLPSYEERFPDWECRNEAFAAKAAWGCVGCYTPNPDSDRVLDDAYRKCVARKAK
jgi:hypothetical protein